jgi:hypothetical protein
MDVNLISQAIGAQSAGAVSAEAPVAADAALFQNLLAAALLQKGGAALLGTTVLGTDAENAGETEGADPGLLMKLLLGESIFAGAGSADAETVVSGESLLLAITRAPAEELLAAAGEPDSAVAATVLADVEGILAALAGGAPASLVGAAEGLLNSAAVETLIANEEAVKTVLPANFAGDLKSLMTDGETAAKASETLVSTLATTTAAPAVTTAVAENTAAAASDAKATQVRTTRSAGAESRTTVYELPKESAETPKTDDGATAAIPVADELPANGVTTDGVTTDGVAATTALGAAEATGKPAKDDAAQTRSVAAGPAGPAQANPHDGAAATATSRGAQTAAPEQVVSRPEPYSQITRELLAALANKNVPTVLSMRLEPAELGKIDVSMKLTSGGKLVIDIAAESAKTQALLIGQTDKLVQALGLQNVQVESVNTTSQAALSGQQPQWAYADRSMAFFMDLAQNGGRETREERSDGNAPAQTGQSLGGIAEESDPSVAKQYARRLDLTA